MNPSISRTRADSRPLLGLAALPPSYLLVVFGIVIAYFLSAELTKHLFYRVQERAHPSENKAS